MTATIVFLWIILDISNDSIIRSIKVSPYIPLSKQQWGRGMTATMVFLWIIFDICTHSSIIQLQPFHKQHAPVFFWSSLLEFRFCVGYVNKCAPIYNLAIKGDWKEAKTMLAKDRRLATAAISQGWATLLHVAAEANHLHFVEELVKQLSEGELELQDHKGNIAFCFAAAVGNVKIAEAMARKNRSLPTIRGGEGLTPLHLAALQGKSEMAWYLYTDTVRNLNHKFDDADWSLLFFLCINTGIYDLALKMLQENPRLAVARNENKETSLHVLARKPSAFSCQGRSTFKLNISKSFLRRALADDHKISLCNAHFADNRDFSHCLIAKEKQKLFARLRRICQYTQHPKKLWAWHLGLV